MSCGFYRKVQLYNHEEVAVTLLWPLLPLVALVTGHVSPWMFRMLTVRTWTNACQFSLMVMQKLRVWVLLQLMAQVLLQRLRFRDSVIVPRTSYLTTYLA